MSIQEANDISLDDTSCQILTVSSSLSQAISLIHRVQNIGTTYSSIGTIEDAIATSSSDPSSPVTIPWTISNRYYSADVHFAAHTVHGLSPHRLKNVAAVMFVWARGEPYRHNIERISRDLAGCEPEVSLAVRVSHDPSLLSPNDTEEIEDDSEIDGFLSSHRFEYIDATEERALNHAEAEEREVFADGIPHLPRVLDALSTVMWPSMQTRSRERNKRSNGLLKRDRSLLDWVQNSRDQSISLADDIVDASRSHLYSSSTGRKHEMQELALWLSEDQLMREDPWKSAAESGTISFSPTAIGSEDDIPAPGQQGFGFDDDFTVFVSAPAVTSNPESRHSIPDIPFGDSPAALAPPHGDLYRSLGSVSDFSGSEDGKYLNLDEEKDGEDDGLPTQEEIQVTSARIFGTGISIRLPNLESRSQIEQPTSSRDSHPSIQTPQKLFDEPSLDTDEPDGSYDMAPFDLSKVLSALQEMKAEIASMEDEGERRRAAAKVALGLVYGLEADAGLDLEH